MSSDRSTRPDRPKDDAFSDALDDLFGAPHEDPSPSPQASSVPHESAAEPQPGQPSPAVATASAGQYYPQSGTSAPPAAPDRGRSLKRTLGIGCAGMLTLLFVCMVALAIIGWLAGDTSSTT